MRLTGLVGSSGSSANDREEIRFAKDSPLEEDGFERSVPLHMLTISGPPLVGSVTVPFAKAEITLS